ncbi:MAG: type II toxin-antitoxin system VapC family toxin [Roseiflexaceae bacterium]
MKLLLDTHTFIWWDSDPQQLSPRVISLCSDTGNDLFVSAASLWEMQIKQNIGKLNLRISLSDMVHRQQITNNLFVLAIHQDHIFGLENLPNIHKDPFDRILIAQANTEGMLLLSADTIFSSYPVQVIW